MEAHQVVFRRIFQFAQQQRIIVVRVYNFQSRFSARISFTSSSSPSAQETILDSSQRAKVLLEFYSQLNIKARFANWQFDGLFYFRKF